jgi:hypothetical protein
MIDQALTYLIVLCAAAFVIWRLFLPVRYKTLITHAASGTKAPCAPEPETGLCGTGCSGCALAAPRSKTGPLGQSLQPSRESSRN